MPTIILNRFKHAPIYTLGHLEWPGGECWTLEHPARKEKIMGRTGIPTGVYFMKLAPSQRFKKNMPFVVDVPNFRGIMFHTGNNLGATRGCILVGNEYFERDNDAFLKDSKTAFQKFRNWFAEAWLESDFEPIRLSIVDGIL